jgi:hypothetical protein
MKKNCNFSSLNIADLQTLARQVLAAGGDGRALCPNAAPRLAEALLAICSECVARTKALEERVTKAELAVGMNLLEAVMQSTQYEGAKERIREQLQDLAAAERVALEKTCDTQRAKLTMWDNAIDELRSHYTEDIFPVPDEAELLKAREHLSLDRLSADMARRTCDSVKKIYARMVDEWADDTNT